MTVTACHADLSTSLARARALLLDVFGVQRVSRWCEVKGDAVYQWLSRGTPELPIPPRYVPCIVRGATAEGIAFDVRDLWPGASDVAAAVEAAKAAETLRQARAH